MQRRTLALIAVLALAALAGCTGIFGPEEVDEGQLNENASYDWETESNASITLNRTSYRAVYDVPDNSSVTIYSRDDLGREESVPVSALRFRFDNGTVISPANSSLTARRTGRSTVIDLPNNSSGQVAYSAPRQGKSFSTPVYTSGNTYSVTLPPGRRVGIPLLSQVTPGGYETSVDQSTDRMTVTWSEPVDSRAIRVRFYLQRDLYIFGGLAAIAIVVGTVGTVYYWRQLQAVRRRRKEAGIDLEEEYDDEDFGDDGPPPGMR
ncbi:DUF5803 family protein [Haloarcula onubensis]|uniref:DUF5803 family protein n=1 Tax=Haloarcula onubensis TaxID=2950539 RepID=A0ABU2FV53_9EURY|nr:DUF5803 family protein [Halomicroarcula sp. S3CR25-11]MDS0284137.1 DUF5803 family protein [Halomicroarcula sp. S3CR25-11]